jgi:hypothetical protein
MSTRRKRSGSPTSKKFSSCVRPRRVRGAGEIAPVGERVQERGLADIGSSGERDFRHDRLRQEPEPGRRLQESDLAREELAGDLVRIGRFGFVAHFASAGVLRPG